MIWGFDQDFQARAISPIFLIAEYRLGNNAAPVGRQIVNHFLAIIVKNFVMRNGQVQRVIIAIAAFAEKLKKYQKPSAPSADG